MHLLLNGKSLHQDTLHIILFIIFFKLINKKIEFIYQM